MRRRSTAKRVAATHLIIIAARPSLGKTALAMLRLLAGNVARSVPMRMLNARARQPRAERHCPARLWKVHSKTQLSYEIFPGILSENRITPLTAQVQSRYVFISGFSLNKEIE